MSDIITNIGMYFRPALKLPFIKLTRINVEATDIAVIQSLENIIKLFKSNDNSPKKKRFVFIDNPYAKIFDDIFFKIISKL